MAGLRVVHVLAGVSAGGLFGGCDERVPLGSWAAEPPSASGGTATSGGTAGSPGTTGGASGATTLGGAGGNGEPSGEAGAAAASGEGPDSDRLCGLQGTPGPLNTPGTEPARDVTLTYRDYSWPSPVDSIEWEVRVESNPPTDGYFWAHDFRFTSRGAGLIGIQKNGVYQAEPPLGFSEFADMFVFWISPNPLRAELGDVPSPLARTATTVDATTWLTIHAKYAWQPCKSYFIRVGQHAVEPSGAVWYGAWIREGTSSTETFVGRILVPGTWGKIADKSSAFSNRIGWGPAKECGAHEYASAYFGLPTANGGTVRPTSFSDRFGDPLRCPTSRMTEFSDGVRHELGLPLP